MTVRELIGELECFSGDDQVVFKASNSMYVDSVDLVDMDTVRAFYGDDYDAVVVYASEQVGAV